MIVRPSQNIIYQVEKQRLSDKLLGQLKKVHDLQTLQTFKSSAYLSLSHSMIRLGDSAYRDACTAVNVSPDIGQAVLLQRQLKDKALSVATQIAGTTGVALGIAAGISKDRAVSRDRADLIAVDNLAVAFFRGTRFGWGLNKRSRKQWHVSDGHDKDDICDDNEDDGPIAINEPFQSGDFEPPAHPWCDCEMELILV